MIIFTSQVYQKQNDWSSSAPIVFIWSLFVSNSIIQRIKNLTSRKQSRVDKQSFSFSTVLSFNSYVQITETKSKNWDITSDENDIPILANAEKFLKISEIRTFRIFKESSLRPTNWQIFLIVWMMLFDTNKLTLKAIDVDELQSFCLW